MLVDGCGSDGCSYSTWTIEDIWANSPKESDRQTIVTFEYPSCFKLSKAVEAGIFIDAPSMPGAGFERVIDNQGEPSGMPSSGQFSYLLVQVVPFEQLTQLPITDYDSDTIFDNLDVETVFEKSSDTLEKIWGPRLSYEKTTVGGYNAVTVKHRHHAEYHEEPYKNRIIVSTFAICD